MHSVPFGTFRKFDFFGSFLGHFLTISLFLSHFVAENCVFLEFFWCNWQKIFGSKCTQEPPGPIPVDPRPHFQNFYLGTKIALKVA